MKKHVLTLALLSAGLFTQVANAGPASSVLEWRGYVSGAFAGSDIGLTGLGGGSIDVGALSIDEDGALTTERAIIIEAHAMDKTDPSAPVIDKENFYDGDVKWTVTGSNINHPAYDVTKLEVTINGKPVDAGTPVVTTAGAHTAAFSVTTEATDADKLKPGDAVSITTLVYAEADAGAGGGA